MEKRYCPICKEVCKKKDCSWYSERYDECVFYLLGEAMVDLMVLFDDKGAKVEILE